MAKLEKRHIRDKARKGFHNLLLPAYVLVRLPYEETRHVRSDLRTDAARIAILICVVSFCMNQ